MTTPAVPGNAVLDRVELAVDAEEWRIRPVDRMAVHELAEGGRRVGLPVRESSDPLRSTTRTFQLSWAHLDALRDTLEELLSVPQVHELVLWRSETLAWRGDGARTEFHLPNGWILAVDVVSPPDGLPAAGFEPRVKVTRFGEVLTFASVSLATWDAGDPPSGTVWFLEESSRFRLADPPADGEIVYASVVPVYRAVHDARQSEIRLGATLLEPRDLLLLET